VLLPVRGRTLFRWLPVDARYLTRRRTGRLAYRSEVRLAGLHLPGGTPPDIAPPAAVGRLQWEATGVRGRTAAVLVHPDGSRTVCLEVEGPGVGLADAAERESAAARWSTMLRDLANAGGLVDRVSLLERAVPSDPEAHRRYIEEFGWVPSPVEALVRSYDDLQRSVDAVSAQHRNYVVLRVLGGRRLAAAVKEAGGGPLAVAAVVGREATAMAARLDEAGVRVLRPLDEPALAALVSSCYGPFRSIDDTDGMRAGLAWPRESQARDDHVEADGWCHATAWIRSWPSLPVSVDFLSPLLVQAPGVVRTVAATFQLSPTEAAIGRALADLTQDEAHLSASARAGRTVDPRDGQQRSQAERRADDLAAGAAGVRLTGWVTVSAATAEQLGEAKRVVVSAAARSHLVLEWCDREHDGAFVNTLPLARGIR
jgi:hypothetical protein